MQSTKSVVKFYYLVTHFPMELTFKVSKFIRITKIIHHFLIDKTCSIEKLTVEPLLHSFLFKFLLRRILLPISNNFYDLPFF